MQLIISRIFTTHNMANSNITNSNIKEQKIITQRCSNFSIDHILNHAGQNKPQNKFECFQFPDSSNTEIFTNNAPVFDWLYYTRYHPPRLPRTVSGLKQPVKRTPGRLPRVPFSPEQLKALEGAYKKSMYLSSEEANELAKQLDLSSIRVKIWFQNRRARDRRENRVDITEISHEAPHGTWHEKEKLIYEQKFKLN